MKLSDLLELVGLLVIAVAVGMLWGAACGLLVVGTAFVLLGLSLDTTAPLRLRLPARKRKANA